MHEFALAQSLISAILPKVPAGARVTKINLSIGVLAGIALSSLEFGLEVASRGTPAERAELSVKTIPLSCLCRDCGKEYSLNLGGTLANEGDAYHCPHCRAGLGEIFSGREMTIDSIEIEEKKSLL
ncbi:MAG TPA: hydrogenase maturation nickel metallochaperone HypA [Chroococcales cyanobacterium]|jgi:hydrogenase nickel incorporation protein HypA/HybF